MFELHNETTCTELGDKVNLQPARFTSFIKCDCQHCGGLMINGIELDYHRFEHTNGMASSHVFLSIVRQAQMAEKMTFWDRIKLMWRILRGEEESEIRYDDIVLNKQGVKQLQATCEMALGNWPLDEDLKKPRPTLEELYQTLIEKERRSD